MKTPAWIMTAVLTAAPAQAGEVHKRLAAMSAEQIAAAIEPQADRATRGITLSSERAFQANRRSPIREMLPDGHLRAVIDRTTGTVRYEVHQSLFYWGSERHFTQARIGEGQAIVLHGNEAGGRFCPNEDNWGHCALNRRISFEIGEHTLRAIAARHDTAPHQGARIRIEERDGRHWDAAIAPTEAAGLLMAVERERRRHG